MASFLKGAALAHEKETADSVSVVMPPPQRVRILMSQHLGTPCTVKVTKGDQVKVGTLIGDSEAFLSAPIHASVSGTVVGIEEVLMPNSSRVEAVVIEADGLQTAAETVAPPTVTDHASFIKAVREAGIVGLGGAGFPTHIKLNPKNFGEIETLIINGAECEPFMTSDNRTMLELSEQIFAGINAVLHYLKIPHCIIVIEDNKKKAIALLGEMAKKTDNITVHVLPSLYPQGAEKVLIYNVLGGQRVPEGGIPADIGVIVQNVTTIAEIGDYLATGMPLVSKRVTVEGAVAKPQNVVVPIGTSCEDVILFAGGYKGTPSKIIMGGPMMGIAVSSGEFPTVKNNNALVVFDRATATRFQETPCISCGRCVNACPMELMPSLLKTATHHEDLATLEDLRVDLCMECGCCAFVCPAKQELVVSHRRGKKLIKNARAKANA